MAVTHGRRRSLWDEFTAFTRTWLTLESAAGPDAVRDAWLALLALLGGDIDAAVGLKLSPWDAA